MVRIIIIFVTIIIQLHASETLASSWYYEVQGGVSQINGGSPFFDSSSATAGSTSDLGITFNLTIAHSFSGGKLPLEFQLGLQQRLISATDNGSTYSIYAPYPIVRLQISRLYVGAGLTPIVFRQAGSSLGFDQFSMVSGSIGFMCEGGLLWPVTPFFSLAAVGAAQYITTSGTVSPGPVLEALGMMRFYFGYSHTADEVISSGEFRGWRYPFGNEIRN